MFAAAPIRSIDRICRSDGERSGLDDGDRQLYSLDFLLVKRLDNSDRECAMDTVTIHRSGGAPAEWRDSLKGQAEDDWKWSQRERSAR